MSNDTGWKFVINIPPRVYKDHVIIFKPRPHARESEESVEYRRSIENKIRTIIEEPFTVPVQLEMDFYMPTKHIAYPTSVAHCIARSLVPALIAEPRLLTQVTGRVHYNDADDPKWAPRTELTVIPVGMEI
jgi:hypothetical protein